MGTQTPIDIEHLSLCLTVMADKSFFHMLTHSPSLLDPILNHNFPSTLIKRGYGPQSEVEMT